MTDQHPHILLTNDRESSLPSVAALRKAVDQPGPRQKLWETVRAQAEARLGSAPISG
jgi:hypothetical protein